MKTRILTTIILALVFGPAVFAKEYSVGDTVHSDGLIYRITKVINTGRDDYGNYHYVYETTCDGRVPGNTSTSISISTNVPTPSDLVAINVGAFEGASDITSIRFYSLNLRDIGDRAFRGCSGLTTIDISANVEEISESAFAECSKLSSVNPHQDRHYLC